MSARDDSEPKTTTVEPKSEREIVVTRTFEAPARLVFEAWTRPELFQQWWIPKSMGMVLHSCEMDVRAGGKYCLNFGPGMDFFGTYLEVAPNARLKWTNEEGDGGAVRFLTERGLADVLPRFVGARPTWQWALPSGLTLRLQLDHLLHDAHFVAIDAGIVAAGRSDHVPIWVDLERP